MASILLLGPAEPMLEGLMQALVAAGHQAQIATTIAEAAELTADAPPLAILADRRLTAMHGLLNLPLLPGGAFLLYRSDYAPAPALSAALQRATLADLMLPLEQQRLLALLQHVEQRALTTGRHTGEHAAERRPRRPSSGGERHKR